MTLKYENHMSYFNYERTFFRRWQEERVRLHPVQRLRIGNQSHEVERVEDQRPTGCVGLGSFQGSILAAGWEAS